jgi:hypothetical protein
MRLPETEAIVLLMALFFLLPLLFFPVFAPVIRLFSARAFSFAISMAFPAIGAHLRPVNRLYFLEIFSRARGRHRRGRI